MEEISGVQLVVHAFAGFFDKQIVTCNIASDVTIVKCLQTGAAA
jgi:hypothetical protein